MLDMTLNFFRMGGYGFYVWLSYGAVLTFLGWQLWQSWRHFSYSNNGNHE